jgi:thiol:disulfide interchange protein DsbC
LFEVRVGGDIIYTDEKAQFLFVGNVVDAKSGTNYTRNRVEELNKIKFSDLPLDSALKMVKGDGKRVIAVFEDPNCGYCKRFRKTLASLDNVTVYTFMYNILSEDSVAKSKNIWCSSDRNKAWDEWMLNGKMPTATAPANCVTPHDKVYALGRKLNNGTPAVFFTDGTRIPGGGCENAGRKVCQYWSGTKTIVSELDFRRRMYGSIAGSREGNTVRCRRPAAKAAGLFTIRKPLRNRPPYCSIFARVIAVVRPEQQELITLFAQAGCEIVLCAGAEHGMGHSLAAGVAAAADRASVMIALADMPFVQPVTLQLLAQAAQGESCVVQPVFQKQGRTSCAVLQPCTRN